MSNRSTVELNHDHCPSIEEQDELLLWATRMCRFMMSGDYKELPTGVAFICTRHHSDESVIEEMIRVELEKQTAGNLVLEMKATAEKRIKEALQERDQWKAKYAELVDDLGPCWTQETKREWERQSKADSKPLHIKE